MVHRGELADGRTGLEGGDAERGLTDTPMSGFINSLKRLVKARCDRLGTSAEDGPAVTPGLPERCRVPVRSAVLPLCDGPRRSRRVTKCAVNFIIGAAHLMAGTPVLLAAVVWLYGARPVLVRLIRVTRAGGLMQVTKLRTVTVQNPDAEWTVSHDLCTRVSRLLPQLLNVVIRGQISLVGTHPDRPYLAWNHEGAMASQAISNMPWPRVSVVVPALNEARNLPHVFARLPADVYEVIVVDGHSVDDTIAVARQLRPDVRVVQQTRRGKGNALACGFAAATGDVIAMVDADGSADPGEIPNFVQALLSGADFAKGTRFAAGGGSSDITRLRSLGNRLLGAAVNLSHGTHYSISATDSTCSGRSTFRYWASTSPLRLHPGRRAAMGRRLRDRDADPSADSRGRAPRR